MRLEFNREMSTPTPPSFPLPVPPPATSVIDDLPCRSCGYNLRTLATEGVCPECATPVAASLRSELLRDADPDWLWHMHSGCKLLYWGIWGAWLSYIFFRAISLGLIRTFALPASSAVAAVGTWMLTSPDPSGIGEDRYGRPRAWARGLGIVQFAATLVASLSATAAPGVHFLLEGLQMLALTAWGAIMLWYLDRLGKRTSQSKIGRGFRIDILLFMGLSVVSLAAWMLQTQGLGLKNPLSFALGFPFSWLNILLIYGAVGAFDKALKAEVAAARGRTLSAWRTAGTFLYWIKQIFRRTNGNKN
jgi:hypothetical protein